MAEEGTASAESRLTRLIDRLLTGADGAISNGDLDLAREMASDVLMVDPENARALELTRMADERQRSRHGERTVMTIMFSDLVDSTPLADIEEPELVRDIFGIYREEAKLAVERFGGRIVNYQGDGVVATFGYPESHEDDARRAVLAGLELLAGVERVAEDAFDKHGVEVQVRVGIHTGLVVVADIGSGKAIERGAIVGVTPNLAARIQGEARPGQVVISDVTQHIVEPDFDLESLGAQKLKGIAREVELFRVRQARHVSERLATERFNAAQMVGRSDVEAQLTAKWDAAKTGHVPTTMLLGAAGIGKSRAVAEFRKQVAADGGMLFDLGCLPYYSNSSMWPASQSLLKRAGIAQDATETIRIAALTKYLEELGLDLEPHLALLAPLVGVDQVPGHPAPQLNPTALRQAVLKSFHAVITAGLGEAPTALIVEDVHWADPSTLDLVGLVGSEPIPGLMVLITSRLPLTEPWAESVDIVELDRIDDEAAAQLVAGLDPADDIDDSLRRTIVERAGGIPLYIEELTRNALTSGGAVPVRLQEVLAARLRQPGVDLDLAQTAATVGNEFDSHLLEVLFDDPGELSRRLDSLEAAEIVQKLDDAGDRYKFQHALLRDAAYETQVLEGRRDWHGRIAGALVEGGGDPSVIAGHFDRAGAVGEAIMHYGIATQAAQAAGAHAEATQLASRALELVATLEAGEERDMTELGMLMLRGLSVSSIRGYAAPEVEADFRRANELSEKLGTAPEIMPAAFGIWSFALVAGDIASANLLAVRLRSRVEDGTGAWFAPEVDAALGYQSLFEGDLDEAAAAFDRSLRAFEQRDPAQLVSEYWPLPNDPVAIALIGQSVVLSLQGHLEVGAAKGAAAVARAEEVPFPRGPFTLAFVKVYQAWLALLLGNREESQHLGEETTQIGAQYGYEYWMALGAIYHKVSDPDLPSYQQSMAILRAIGHEAFRASYMAYEAELQQAAGDPGAALETIHDAMLVIGKSGELLHRPDVMRMRGALTLTTGGDAKEALEDLRQAHDLAAQSGNAIYALRAALDIARLDSRPDDSAAMLDAAVQRFEEDAAFPDLDAARALLRDL